MSKTLSSERQRALDAAHKYKGDADLIWLALLKPYCNTLAQSDKAFVISLCERHKTGVVFVDLASCLTTFEAFADDDGFANCEARFVDAAGDFFGAARAMFFDLQKHFKETRSAVYERMPDAANQLREIIRAIDGKLDHANELKQIRADRLNASEIPLGFQAISQAQEIFFAAREATRQQALSGKQPIGAVTLHALARAALKRNHERFLAYFAERQREPLDADERAEIAAALDALGRLYDLNTRPAREDRDVALRALQDCDALRGVLGMDMEDRRGAVDGSDWAKAEARDFDRLLREQIADARIEQLRERNAHLPAMAIPLAGAAPAVLKSTRSTQPVAQVASATVEADKLDLDRRRYETNGKVTNRLLQAMWNKSHSTVSYRLGTLYKAGKINSAEAGKLTKVEVQIVIEDVAENPFREKTQKGN